MKIFRGYLLSGRWLFLYNPCGKDSRKRDSSIMLYLNPGHAHCCPNFEVARVNLEANDPMTKKQTIQTLTRREAR